MIFFLNTLPSFQQSSTVKNECSNLIKIQRLHWNIFGSKSSIDVDQLNDLYYKISYIQHHVYRRYFQEQNKRVKVYFLSSMQHQYGMDVIRSDIMRWYCVWQQPYGLIETSLASIQIVFMKFFGRFYRKIFSCTTKYKDL